MIESDSPRFDECCEHVVNRCKKIARVFLQNRLEADFVCETLVLELVEIPACTPRCLDKLPREIVTALLRYCERELPATNFMPNPVAHLPLPASEEAIQMTKMEMQRAYRLLFQAVTEYLNTASDS
jgi:hypothetical protein